MMMTDPDPDLDPVLDSGYHWWMSAVCLLSHNQLSPLPDEKTRRRKKRRRTLLRYSHHYSHYPQKRLLAMSLYSHDHPFSQLLLLSLPLLLSIV